MATGGHCKPLLLRDSHVEIFHRGFQNILTNPSTETVRVSRHAWDKLEEIDTRVFWGNCGWIC